MKRYAIIVVLFSLIVFAALTAAAAPVSIVNSKHNLSGNPANPSTYKSEDPATDSFGTDEICVFCHTPHGGNTEAPLWNRNLYQSTPSGYTPYTSDVLSALSYTAMDDPYVSAGAGVIHVKTRICLSCHDGTIAMGNLVNLPYGKTNAIPIQNTGGTGVMPATAAGYIGVNFRDDHPVAVMHDNAKDLELEPAITADAPNVNLYRLNAGKVEKTRTAGSANYVECTSCHDPHDNQYGNFLVDSNQNSKICTSCHRKTGFTSSIHNTAVGVSHSYSPPTNAADPVNPQTIGTKVGEVKCMNCHFPHKAGVTSDQPTTPQPDSGKYLLSFWEEASCFNNTDRWGAGVSVCHGTGAAAQTKNIEDLVAETMTSKHPVRRDTMVGLHEASEAQAQGWLGAGNTKWHVECADCHNPHTAGPTAHTASPPLPVFPSLQQLTTASPLYGTGGVQIDTWPTWASPNSGTFTYKEPIGAVDKNQTATGVLYEYQICMKCHSNYAWNLNPPPASPSFIPAANMTNQAAEFNPANIYSNDASAHPVAGTTQHVDGTLVGAWNTNRGNQTMYCSDCHNNDNAAGPQGSHGSGQQFLLSAIYTDTYSTTKTDLQPSGDLCFTCHSEMVYQSGTAATAGTGFSGSGTNLHTQHRIQASGYAGSTFGYRCVNCHTRVPHGYNRKAMIVLRNEGAPYEAGGTGLGKIQSATLPASGTYLAGSANKNASCTTVAGCH